MKDIREKVETFDYVLQKAVEKLKPSLVLIACNTLSVVYAHSKLQFEGIEIKGIIDNGVDAILEQKNIFPNSQIVLIGTTTTINSEVHKIGLINRGIKENEIINQACPKLESEIQDKPNGKETHRLIKKYASEVKQKFNITSEGIIVALLCTHYGFSQDLISRIFSEIFDVEVKVANPNKKMAKKALSFIPESKLLELNCKVISPVKYSNEEILGLYNILKIQAKNTAEALLNLVYVDF